MDVATQQLLDKVLLITERSERDRLQVGELKALIRAAFDEYVLAQNG